MRYNDIPEPRLEPPEDKIYGYCAHCKGEVYSDSYIYNGEMLCEDCYNEAHDIGTVIDFISAYPQTFYEYLRETLDVNSTKEALTDYRDYAQEFFDDWVVR